MNKQNITNTTNATCGSKTRNFNKNKIRVPHTNIAKSCTSGSYITYVNLYLHPNSPNNSANGSTLSSPIDQTNQVQTNQTTEKKIKGNQKPKCSNKECHYYDPICDENYFCCNPSCSCFDPYYFEPYYNDPYYFDPYFFDY
jgi:hypothetical protein